MHLSKEAIGSRLQEERKRLGLNQDAFAQHLGVAKRTLAGYEGGAGDVGALVLGHASALGVDVLYVVTGERRPAAADSITGSEMELLEHYRNLSDGQQEYTKAMVAALSEVAGRISVKK